jgi:hypothetical protein
LIGSWDQTQISRIDQQDDEAKLAQAAGKIQALSGVDQ